MIRRREKTINVVNPDSLDTEIKDHTFERPKTDRDGNIIGTEEVTVEANTAWVIFDGRKRIVLKKGRHNDLMKALEVAEDATPSRTKIKIAKIDPRTGNSKWGPAEFTGAQADNVLRLLADQEINI